MTITVADIAARIDAEVMGDGDLEISSLGSLGTAVAGQLSHLSSPSYKKQLAGTGASAVIVKPDDAEACPVTALVVGNPYLAFARAAQLFAKHSGTWGGVHASAVLGQDCQIDESASIGAGVYIGDGVRVGAGVRIAANTVIGDCCVLDEDVVLHGNVTLYADVKIGARSIVHSNAVIGGDGFGFTPDESGKWQEISQLGGVTIGADVSIGACSSIDCGAIDDTVVEDGVKIDNQVQIGHNCRIGAHTLICGCVGIAGSTVLGKHCVLAGASSIGGDQPITLCEGVVVTACTTISQSVDQPGVYSGSIVFHEHGKWRRNAMRFFALDDLFKRVRRLEKGG